MDYDNDNQKLKKDSTTIIPEQPLPDYGLKKSSKQLQVNSAHMCEASTVMPDIHHQTSTPSAICVPCSCRHRKRGLAMNLYQPNGSTAEVQEH